MENTDADIARGHESVHALCHILPIGRCFWAGKRQYLQCIQCNPFPLLRLFQLLVPFDHGSGVVILGLTREVFFVVGGSVFAPHAGAKEMLVLRDSIELAARKARSQLLCSSSLN